jgi:hypothetical protein
MRDLVERLLRLLDFLLDGIVKKGYEDLAGRLSKN